MRMRFTVALAFGLAIAGPGAVRSDQPLPVPAEELVAAYSGKTISWSDASLYWSPDGKIIGVAPGDMVGEGSWTAVDGKICFETAWHGPPGSTPYALKNCYGYMRLGPSLVHQFTSEKTKGKTGWYAGDSDLQALMPGNLLQQRYDALKAKRQARSVQHYTGMRASQPFVASPQD